MDGLFSDMNSAEQSSFIADNFVGEVPDISGAEEDEDNNNGEVAESGIQSVSEGTENPDTGAEATEGPAASGVEKAPEGEGENASAPKGDPLYTPEEYLSVDPLQVDASRLPDAARLVHERDIQLYKTQILPALAERDKELQELRAYKEAVEAEKIAKSAPSDDQGFDIEQVTPQMVSEYAVKETARRLDVAQLDPANPQHMSALAVISTEIAQTLSQKKAEIQEAKRIEAQKQMKLEEVNRNFTEFKNRIGAEPNFDAVNVFAVRDLENLPYKVSMQVKQELASGDFRRIEGVYRFFEKRYAQYLDAQKKVEPTVNKKVVEVPKVIGGSNAAGIDKKPWNLVDFRNASARDQARMLADMA